MDFHDLVDMIEQLHFLGNKGPSGTQGSYLPLFDNDPSKIKQMEKMVADEMGFSKLLSI
jgi:adenylosuccinate lyase